MPFKVDFTSEDKQSTTRIFEPLPTNRYECAVTDVTLNEVKNGDNAGKPMLNVELTVQSGEFANRKVFCNVMLFTLARGNFFLAQFLKATGNQEALETGVIPDADAFLGKVVHANIAKVRDKYKNERETDPNVTHYRNEVKGFFTEEDSGNGTPAGKGKKNPLAP